MNYKLGDVLNEDVMQMQVFQWAAYEMGKYPQLALMYHIPNEGKRSLPGGYKMKLKGLKPGVPDICLPVPKTYYGALYIELKMPDGRHTAAQSEYMQALRDAGNYVKTCRSVDDAIKTITDYMNEKF